MSYLNDNELADIKNRFEYHAPDDVKVLAHTVVRGAALDLAIVLAALVPHGRERSLMLTALEEAVFWANAGIARSANYGETVS